MQGWPWRNAEVKKLRENREDASLELSEENFDNIGSLAEIWRNEYLLKESYWDVNQSESS
jgi:hypothetical protein